MRVSTKKAKSKSGLQNRERKRQREGILTCSSKSDRDACNNRMTESRICAAWARYFNFPTQRPKLRLDAATLNRPIFSDIVRSVPPCPHRGPEKKKTLFFHSFLPKYLAVTLSMLQHLRVRKNFLMYTFYFLIFFITRPDARESAADAMYDHA